MTTLNRADLQSLLWNLPEGQDYCLQFFDEQHGWVFSQYWIPLSLVNVKKQSRDYKGSKRRIVKLCRWTCHGQVNYPTVQSVVATVIDIGDADK